MQIANSTGEFLQAVWGDGDGTRFVVIKPVGGAWKHIAVSTNDDALRRVEAAVTDGVDCYFGVNLFKNDRRTADQVSQCRAFFIDIDIRLDDPKCYDSVETALGAVKSFLTETGMPEPTILNSGNGLHCYWILDSAVSAETWSENARSLKTLCKVQGLRADASVTADVARVLRVPGSRNYKQGGDGKPCDILTSIRRYKLAELPIHPPHPVLTESPTVNDIFLSGIATASEDAKDVARLCVSHLNGARCDDYQGWLCAGIALYRVFEGDTEGLDLWDAWSRQSCLYRQDACTEKWSGFGGERSDAIGLGSLVHWAKSDSAEFRDIWERHTADKRADRLASRSNEIQFTDLGNSQRLIALHGDDIRYDADRKLWFAWNGRYWKENAEADVRQLAKQTVKFMYAEAARIEDADRRTALAKHAGRSEAASKLRAIVDLAWDTPDIQAGVRDFDAFPQLLNVANGVVDLRTGTLYPHAREFMLAKYVPMVFDPHAACPVFEKFLHRIFGGNRDVIEWVQRAVGYTMTGETSEQVFFICYGEGANGKSTLLEVIHDLLGELAGTIRTDALMQQRFSGSAGHTEDIANLLGLRFVSASETESGQHLAEATLKQITGGDTITASRKYGRTFKFKPAFKLWLAANHRPQIQGTDAGIWRRIRLIPFNEFIPEPERDLKIRDKLTAESSGILNWAVRGAVKWYQSGLGKSPDVESATHAYRSEQDSIERFLAECCESGSSFAVSPTVLYAQYKEWCSESGVSYLNHMQFPSELQKRGLVKKQVSGLRQWQGIRLRTSVNLTAIIGVNN